MHKLNLYEAKELKKNEFTFFLVDEVKDADAFTDLDSIGEKKNIEVYLVTDKTHKEVDPAAGKWYKIPTDKFLKHVTGQYDKLSRGDNFTFPESYKLATPIIAYIEDNYEAMGFENYDTFKAALEGQDIFE